MDSLTATAQIEGLDTVLPLLEEARHEEALPLIEDKLAKQPDVPLWKYIKALVVACQARGGESVALLSETSKLEGFSSGFGLPSDVNMLAKASALNHLQFETSVEPGAVEPWLHLEQVARILGNGDFLTRAILGRWKANPEDETAPRRFDEHFKDLSVDDKIKLLEEILEHDQEACLPRACLGYYMQEKGKTALAIRHLKKALESQPQAWQPHLYLGRVFVSQGRFEDAENRFSEAIALRKQGSAELLAEMALCQKATYRYEEAMETYFEALQRYPSEFSHWQELFELAEATGAGERLRQAITKASQEQPHNLELSGRIVALSLKAKDPLAARQKLETSGILQNPGKNVELTVLACEVFLTLGQSEEAVQLLEKALKLEPKSKELRTAFGSALLACDRADEAEVILKETALNHPNERELQVAWGRALLASGEAERGHRAFAVASRLDPSDPEALAEQGRALLAMGQADEAVTLLKESAKQAEPPKVVTLSALGSVYQAKGLKDISKDFFKQALSRDGGCIPAARGWLRMCDQNPRELKESLLELFSEKGTDFERSQLYLNLLHSSLWEGLAESTKLLQQELLEGVKSSIKSPEYLSFLEKDMISRIPSLAAKLEREGMFERAREAWRFAVTSSESEVSQRATSELLRLDTVHAALAKSQANSAEPQEAAAPEKLSPTPAEQEPISALESPVDLSGDDPLLSLLSSTLPVEQAPTAPESVPLFASPTSRPPEPSSPLEESPLFAETPSELPKSLFETSSVSDQLFAQQEEVSEQATEAVEQGRDLEASLFADADAKSEVPEQAEPDLAVLSTPDFPPSELAGAAESQDEVLAETVVDEASLEAALPLPKEALAPPGTSSSLSPPEDAPLITPSGEDEPSLPDPAPAEQEIAPDPDPVTQEASPEPESSPRKELLPIPMAVDFEPLTRRQLHFHEALAQSQSGLLAPENIAHLMVCSSLGHEPPDPASHHESQEQQTLALQEALLSSAQSLANQEQYRSASRLLKTALLYAPDSPKVNGALAAVLMTWSSWLARSQEFAHSVSLLREASRRAPQTAGLEEQLEQTYQSWMTWSDEKGDPAARDLLAVYLQQEQASLQALRTAWKERSAQKATPAPVSVQQAAKVEPTMPTLTEAPPAASAPAIQDAPPSDTVAQVVSEPGPEGGVEASTETGKEETSPAEASLASSPVEDSEIEESTEAPGTEQAESVAEAAPTPKASEVGSFSSSEEAMQALDANPNDKALVDAVFAYHADSMRNLTTALRDKSSAHPDDPIWLLLLARAFRKSGSETMAVIQYQKYIKAAPTPEAYEELAMTYEEIGKEDFAKMTRRKAERAFSE